MRKSVWALVEIAPWIPAAVDGALSVDGCGSVHAGGRTQRRRARFTPLTGHYQSSAHAPAPKPGHRIPVTLKISRTKCLAGLRISADSRSLTCARICGTRKRVRRRASQRHSTSAICRSRKGEGPPTRQILDGSKSRGRRGSMKARPSPHPSLRQRPNQRVGAPSPRCCRSW